MEGKNALASSTPSDAGESPEVVLACVRELDHTSAVVELPGGKQALLPWKNVWSGFKIHDKYTDFRVVEEHIGTETTVVAATESGSRSGVSGRKIVVGDRLRVVPSADRDFGKGKRKIVSHILVDGDPWDAVAVWQASAVKTFAIESVTDSWAWGRIHPGVRARAHLEGLKEILPKDRWPEHRVPVRGDEIAGWYLPEKTDQEKRIVTLDYVGYVKSQISLKEIFEVSASHPVTRPNASDDTDNLLAALVARAKISTLLLVDDDEALCSSLSHFLREECGVETLSCIEERRALKAIEERGADIDLAIIDVNLDPNRGEKDHSGIRVARKIEGELSSCPLVLMTGEELDPGKQAVSDALDMLLNDLVDKPFGQDGLLQALGAPGKAKRPLSDFLRQPSINEAAPVSQPESEIEVVLRDLRDSLGAEAAVLFAINPISDEVAIKALAGLYDKYNTENKPKLGWSPIRDAAVQGETIFTSDALDFPKPEPEFKPKPKPKPKPKHLHLQKAYHYRSCVGVPVRIGAATYDAYALFAFHPDANRFARETALPLALRVAREVGQIFRIGKLEESISEMKPFEMMGQSYGSMAHELARDMSGLFLEEAIGNISSGATADALGLLKEANSRLTRAQRVVRGFKTMAGGKREDINVFRARKEIEEISSRLTKDVQESGARLRFSVDRVAEERCLRMRRSHIDQLLTNLTLNAAQQCERLSQEGASLRTGEVQIEAIEEKDDRGYPWLVLRVHDNGPGIHHKDFERVFELHYTTKTHGCGMGLDISRKIVQDVKEGSLRGTLAVLRSLFLCGTCFEARLPMSLEEETSP